jgi:hypothetical protein
LRYVAVDERCRKRVEKTAGIPLSRITVILNAVDLERFRAREPLPSKPKRALIFSNQTGQVPAIRSAARRMGLELQVLGLGAGNAVPNPESMLRKGTMRVGGDGGWKCGSAMRLRRLRPYGHFREF